MMGRNLMDAGMDGMLLFLPMAVAVVVAAVAADVLISGWVFSTKAFEFDFAKLNPITGLGRLFSWNSLAELVKALMKGGLIAGVAGWMIWHQREGILGLAVEPLDAAMAHFGQITLLTFLAATTAFASSFCWTCRSRSGSTTGACA